MSHQVNMFSLGGHQTEVIPTQHDLTTATTFVLAPNPILTPADNTLGPLIQVENILDGPLQQQLLQQQQHQPQPEFELQPLIVEQRVQIPPEQQQPQDTRIIIVNSDSQKCTACQKEFAS